MKRKHIMIVLGIIGAAILISMFCAWPAIRLNSFHDAEYRALSGFDALNTELFATIPVPDGVVELGQSRNGITSPTTEHGRYLITDYRMSQTQSDAVLEHYKTFFLSEGWKEVVAYQKLSTNSRGTAYIDVSFYGEKYSLNIWHDLWDQEFSPSDPHTKLLEVIELGESTFAVCPPL